MKTGKDRMDAYLAAIRKATKEVKAAKSPDELTDMEPMSPMDGAPTLTPMGGDTLAEVGDTIYSDIGRSWVVVIDSHGYDGVEWVLRLIA